MAIENLDARVAEDCPVNTIQSLNFFVFVRDELGPVEARVHRPAKTCRIGKIFAVVRGVDEQLLGNAADVDASAAEITFLGDGDSGAERSRHPARAYAAGTRADCKKIVIVLRHIESPLTWMCVIHQK